jgi:hypothetical protein
MDAELRKVKVYKGMSEETVAFTAELWWFGNHIGYVKNDGRGGDNHISHLFDGRGLNTGPQVEAFGKWCKDQPNQHGLGMSADLYISLMLDDYELEQQMKRWCKKSTVVKLPEHKDGEWIKLNQPYSPEIAKMVREKYPNVVEIANERYLSGAVK